MAVDEENKLAAWKEAAGNAALKGLGFAMVTIQRIRSAPDLENRLLDLVASGATFIETLGSLRAVFDGTPSAETKAVESNPVIAALCVAGMKPDTDVIDASGRQRIVTFNASGAVLSLVFFNDPKADRALVTIRRSGVPDVSWSQSLSGLPDVGWINLVRTFKEG